MNVFAKSAFSFRPYSVTGLNVVWGYSSAHAARNASARKTGSRRQARSMNSILREGIAPLEIPSRKILGPGLVCGVRVSADPHEVKCQATLEAGFGEG